MNETVTMCMLHVIKEDELKDLKRAVCYNLANDLVTKHNAGNKIVSKRNRLVCNFL